MAANSEMLISQEAKILLSNICNSLLQFDNKLGINFHIPPQLPVYTINEDQTDESSLSLIFDLYHIFNRPDCSLHSNLRDIIAYSNYYELLKKKKKSKVIKEFDEFKRKYNILMNKIIMSVSSTYNSDTRIINIRTVLLKMRLIKNWDDTMPCNYLYSMKPEKVSHHITYRTTQEGTFDNEPILSTHIYLKSKKSVSISGDVGPGLAYKFESRSDLLAALLSALDDAKVSDLHITKQQNVRADSTKYTTSGLDLSINFTLNHANRDNGGKYRGVFNSDDKQITSKLASHEKIIANFPLCYLGHHYMMYFQHIRKRIEELIEQIPFEYGQLCSFKCCNLKKIFIARPEIDYLTCGVCELNKCVRCGDTFTNYHTCIPPLDLMEYIREGGIICPGCQVPVVKDEGCNHMTCARCRTEFCMLCGKKYTTSIDAHHDFNVYGESCMGRETTTAVDLNPISLVERWGLGDEEIREALQVQREIDLHIIEDLEIPPPALNATTDDTEEQFGERLNFVIDSDDEWDDLD